MTILKDVFAELVSMFLGDARLSVSILAVVAVAAALVDLVGFDPLIGGGMLVVGCLATVVFAVVMTARQQRTQR